MIAIDASGNPVIDPNVDEGESVSYRLSLTDSEANDARFGIGETASVDISLDNVADANRQSLLDSLAAAIDPATVEIIDNGNIITVRFTATADGDALGDVVFSAFSTEDTIVEPNTDSFTVAISGESTSVAGGISSTENASAVTSTINDDDRLIAEFSSRSIDLVESGGALPELLVTGEVQTGHSVDVTVGSGGPPEDFEAPGTLAIPGGIYNATSFVIPGLGVRPDGLIESSEVVQLTIPAGGAIEPGDANEDGVPQATHDLVIIDDDGPASWSLASDTDGVTGRRSGELRRHAEWCFRRWRADRLGHSTDRCRHDRCRSGKL